MLIVDKINKFLGTNYNMKYDPCSKTLTIKEPILVNDLVDIRYLDLGIKNIEVKIRKWRNGNYGL